MFLAIIMASITNFVVISVVYEKCHIIATWILHMEAVVWLSGEWGD